MPILHIIVVLVVLGIAWWIFSTYVLPHVAEPFRTIIIVLLALAIICWLLSLIGMLPPLRW